MMETRKMTGLGHVAHMEEMQNANHYVFPKASKGKIILKWM
jgi:hypothetical protein